MQDIKELMVAMNEKLGNLENVGKDIRATVGKVHLPEFHLPEKHDLTPEERNILLGTALITGVITGIVCGYLIKKHREQKEYEDLVERESRARDDMEWEDILSE